ncbi:hypothetical protein [Archangium violaceum]|uniref:hypothetical protein n=1 Tax=Archangium violaceum TaxID=83451 RepID=UPI001EF07B2E|nr:hypothetical protein [Archangium violaceum]
MRHPSNRVFLNTASLSRIVNEGKLGDPKRLSEFVRPLRPDITDTRLLVLFELKPDNEESRVDGREQVLPRSLDGGERPEIGPAE